MSSSPYNLGHDVSKPRAVLPLDKVQAFALRAKGGMERVASRKWGSRHAHGHVMPGGEGHVAYRKHVCEESACERKCWKKKSIPA